MDDRRALWSAVLILGTVTASWLVMQIVHELGHVLHAVLSGGEVRTVVLHPLVISRTDVAPNPHPKFVAWGGAAWGVLLPLLMLGTARLFRCKFTHLVRFFAGFCLIANGCYLAAGSLSRIGDARDLLEHGATQLQSSAFGLIASALGLLLWHRTGRHFGLGKEAVAVQSSTAIGVVIVTLAIIAAELACWHLWLGGE